MQRLCLPIYLLCCAAPASIWGQSKPNVVVILADDLGYSDLGCYGSEIATPHLDGLARDGLRFTQFYNTARCWPTRAALLTGYYAQQVRRDTVPGAPSGGGGTRPAWARLLPEMLRASGYRSYHSGKWHMDGDPMRQGFDRSYLLQDSGRFFSPRTHFENGERLPAVERDSGFYSTAAIVTRALAFLEEHFEQHAEQPFFLYLAHLAPHFPLQALPEDIAPYAEQYTVGWDVALQERRARQNALGIAPGALAEMERDIGPPYDFPEALEVLGKGEVNRPIPWSELNEEQRSFQAAKMSVHAAMIDRMDRETGRIFELLRDHGQWENTLIFFLSDNGASAEIMVRDDGHDPKAAPGSADSHLCLGPGWSTVANTPFRRHKTWAHEGGICTPLIAHWPAGIRARGELRSSPGHVIDLVPTILDATDTSPLDRWEGGAVPPPPGRSLKPIFGEDPEPRHEALWWLHEGNRALRAGDWKIVAAKGDAWELYNLKDDRAETQNLAEQLPDKVRDLADRWNVMHEAFNALAIADLSTPKASE